MVDNRVTVAQLGNCSDRTQLDERAYMVMRAQISVYYYHNLSVFEV